MAASSTLPVVDLAPFFAGDNAGIAGATKAVHEACRTHGFFTAVNHGVPAELLARALELSATFFALPDEEKARVAGVEGSAFRCPAGRFPPGYGRLPANSGDKSEYVVVFDPKLGVNVYPTEPAGFREVAEECYAKLTELALLIQEILNECMGLPPGFLKDYNNDRSFDFMRPKRYWPATEDENTGFCPHEDPNCFTLILQDAVGGLQVLKDGHWIPAQPVSGSIVVNIGDTIQVLSNNKLKSATHRVVRNSAVHRHSLVFFFSFHGDKWVEPLPEFTAKIDEAPQYRGFLYKDYLQVRLRNRTHPPSKTEDEVGIGHYAI